jgi:hypothetical protein
VAAEELASRVGLEQLEAGRWARCACCCSATGSRGPHACLAE